MFGEKNIFGMSKVTTDSKSRIVIPAFTNVEKGDELALIDREDYFEIMAVNELEKSISELEYKLGNSCSLEQYELYKHLLDQLYYNVWCIGIVDGNHRINTNHYLDVNTTYKVVGAKKSIYVMKYGIQKKM